jgi:hypothetical protein
MRKFDEKDTNKNLDFSLIIEFYCDKCNESMTFYPEIDEIKLKRANFS